MKIAESSPKGQKTLWEKDKLLVTSIFSFFHIVFKRLVQKTRKTRAWKRVKTHKNRKKNKKVIETFSNFFFSPLIFIVCMTYNAVFNRIQLHRGTHYTIHVCLKFFTLPVLHTTNILSKSLAAFQHNYHRNNNQRNVRGEWILSQ